MQIISNDKSVRSNTVNDIKKINNQSLATQAKKGEQLVSKMPAIKKAFDLMGDVLVDLSTKNDALKTERGDYYEKWLQESKHRLLKPIEDEKRAKLIMSRMKKTNGKTFIKWPICLIINYARVNLITSFKKEINYKI